MHKLIKMRSLYILSISLFLLSCDSEASHEESNKTELADGHLVQYKGELKKIMHEGDISAKADLKEFEKTDHLYAIGASENLKGEIQIYDGKSYNTYVDDNTLAFDPSFDSKATLLVYATVEEWEFFDIPADIITKEQLESFISETAEEYGIDIHSPFPFVLDGNASFVDWHVINWKEGDTEHTHEKHIQSGLHGTLLSEDARFIGFYSDSHHAIFTHHTTNMHIHFITKDNMVAGHVDDLELGEGMILRLPKQ